MRRITIGGALAATAAAVLLGAGPGAAQTSTLPTIRITITGQSLTVAGTLQSGAVNVTTTTTNKDTEPTLVRLNPGVTAAQLIAAAPKLNDPNDVAPYGSIVFDADAPKGTTTVQTVLPAGNYVALDTQRNVATPPNAAFTIAQSANPASLPAARSLVRAIDFGFRSPRTLHDGTTVRLRNDGFVVHMIAGVRVRNAKAAKLVTRYLRAGKDSKAEKLATGFVNLLGPASHGAVQQMTLSARPGVYVLVCFMTTQDHREHTQLGMLRTVRIKRH